MDNSYQTPKLTKALSPVQLNKGSMQGMPASPAEPSSWIFLCLTLIGSIIYRNKLQFAGLDPFDSFLLLQHYALAALYAA